MATWEQENKSKRKKEPQIPLGDKLHAENATLMITQNF